MNLKYLVKIQFRIENEQRSNQTPYGKGDKETAPGQGTASCHEQNKEKMHTNHEKLSKSKPDTNRKI